MPWPQCVFLFLCFLDCTLKGKCHSRRYINVILVELVRGRSWFPFEFCMLACMHSPLEDPNGASTLMFCLQSKCFLDPKRWRRITERKSLIKSVRPSTQQSRVTVSGNGSALVTSADSFWVFQMAKQQFRKQTMNEKINAVVLLLSWPLSITANATPPPPHAPLKPNIAPSCGQMAPNDEEQDLVLLETHWKKAQSQKSLCSYGVGQSSLAARCRLSPRRRPAWARVALQA